MEEQRVDHASGATAEVNAPAQVSLYDDEGRAFTVAQADEGVWLARGFRRRAYDAKGALKDLPPLWKATHEALKEAVSVTDDDGELDTNEDAAYAAATVALRELNDGIAAVMGALHAVPVKQGKG